LNGGLPVHKPTYTTESSKTQSNGHASVYAGRPSSSSSESSNSMDHPIPPSQLGSIYGPEGFPNYPDGMSVDNNEPASFVNGYKLDDNAQATLDAADRVMKQLNGTDSIYDGYSFGVSPYSTQLPDYQAYLPDFGDIQHHVRPDTQLISRQSSTSSSATEASTSSSEETDLCVPSLVAETPIFGTSAAIGFGRQWAAGAGGAQRAMRSRSQEKMPPPSSSASRQGRRGSNNASRPSGLKNGSALPANVEPEEMPDEEDDEVTVGHGRDRSPSGSSSQSAQSGLDLLLQAAVQQVPPQRHRESRGKRKAGAEAVAQWRTSGIPHGIGATRTSDKPLPENLASVADSTLNGRSSKKRRTSFGLEHIDPALRDEEDSNSLDSSDMDKETGSEFESVSQEEVDEDDAEYEGSKQTATAGGGSGRGRKSTGSKPRTSGGGGTHRAGGAKKGRPSGGGRGGKGGGGSGPRKSGGSASSHVGGGVQCEYINPLPPYNRCQDFFTRKYDLPRHMTRHARREGELVMEGKLAPEKALLWNGIKDKPRAQCFCGETFTRSDALKRHMAKQHPGHRE
jgi:hypothetical protein